MRILILGGTGMLGHRLWLELGQTHDTWGTIRSPTPNLPIFERIDDRFIVTGVDITDTESLSRAFAMARADVVVNCVGLIKQREQAKDTLLAIELNSRFPHQLARLCHAAGSRLIHMSTDCVFSGKKGMYVETDPTDATDVYGKSKALGELLDYAHCVTLRTSIIGRELTTRFGLVEWLLSQQQRVTGFKKAIFSGFTTHAFAEVLRDYILPKSDLHGLFHVSAQPISKYDLLELLNKAYNKNLEITPNADIVIDRSLDSSLFLSTTGFQPPAWPDMIQTMANERTSYDERK